MGPFNVVLGCLLGSILGVSTLSFIAIITRSMLKQQPCDLEKEPYYWKKALPARPSIVTPLRGPPRIPAPSPRRTPIQQSSPKRQRIPHHIKLPPLLHTIDPPRPSLDPSVQQSLDSLPHSVAKRISTQIDGKMGVTVSKGTIITSRPSIEAPRPAPPVPQSIPYSKGPMEHTRHISQPSLHQPPPPHAAATVSVQPSLDQDTLPHTLVLDHRPQELRETRRHSQLSRLFSIFSRNRISKIPESIAERTDPNSSKQNSDDSLLAVPKATPPPQLPQLSPLDFNGLDMSFSSFQLNKSPDQLNEPAQPVAEIWEPDETDVAPVPLVTRSTEYTNSHEPDFDFLTTIEKRGSERWSTASSRFSGQRVVLSATLENLREQYMSSGLNLSYHSKAEYERLAGVVAGSDEDPVPSESDLTPSTPESGSMLRLAPPLQISSGPSSPASLGTPGAYDVRPLSIAKAS